VFERFLLLFARWLSNLVSLRSLHETKGRVAFLLLRVEVEEREGKGKSVQSVQECIKYTHTEFSTLKRVEGKKADAR
jgi:hypothetical protein